MSTTANGWGKIGGQPEQKLYKALGQLVVAAGEVSTQGYDETADEAVLLTVYRAPREFLRVLLNQARRLKSAASFGSN